MIVPFTLRINNGFIVGGNFNVFSSNIQIAIFVLKKKKYKGATSAIKKKKME